MAVDLFPRDRMDVRIDGRHLSALNRRRVPDEYRLIRFDDAYWSALIYFFAATA
jgi:hypothetical protein